MEFGGVADFLERDALSGHGSAHLKTVVAHAELKLDLSSSLEEARGVHLHGNAGLGVLLHELHERGHIVGD